MSDDYVDPQDAITDFRSVPKPNKAVRRYDDDDDDDDYVNPPQTSEVKSLGNIKSGYMDVELKFPPKQKKSIPEEAPIDDDDDAYADLSGAQHVFETGQSHETVMQSIEKELKTKGDQLNGPPPVPTRSTQAAPNFGYKVHSKQDVPLPRVPTRKSLPKRAMKQRLTMSQFCHGKMTREQADDILKPTTKGTFLIRESLRPRHPKYNYVLCSFECHSKDVSPLSIAHFPIAVSEANGYVEFSLPAVENNRWFRSLEDMVNYYNNTNPLVKLVKPVPPS
eukprot:m.171453 g.171453  ORF g.171453 m.171453 type:complete len:278 (-) comp13499_c1_seq2:183-1016(-)